MRDDGPAGSGRARASMWGRWRQPRPLQGGAQARFPRHRGPRVWRERPRRRLEAGSAAPTHSERRATWRSGRPFGHGTRPWHKGPRHQVELTLVRRRSPGSYVGQPAVQVLAKSRCGTGCKQRPRTRRRPRTRHRPLGCRTPASGGVPSRRASKTGGPSVTFLWPTVS